MKYDIRKAFIKDFTVTLSIDHQERMPGFPHLHDADGKPEKVTFNFEIGYVYAPIHADSLLSEVYEYTYICRYIRELQHKKHTCISEFLIEDICNKVMEDKRVLYVKASMNRHQVVSEGIIGVGVEKYSEEYYTRFK